MSTEVEVNPKRIPRAVAFNMLQKVAAGGAMLSPQWEPASSHGYVFEQGQDVDDVKLFERYAQILVRHDYLEQRFFDRITRCPACASQHLNLREVCPQCSSAQLSSEALLHHFRCVYVGPSHHFSGKAKDGRVCPKCAGRLENLGVDHDIPGQSLKCGPCQASFQQPPVSGICLSCGLETPSDRLVSEDIYSFCLAPLGREALRQGRLISQRKERVVEEGLPVLRSEVLQNFLFEEHKRATRYGTPFTALIFDIRYLDEAKLNLEREREIVGTLRAMLRNVDLLGRHRSGMLIASLPMTPREMANEVLQRLVAHFEQLTGVQVNAQVLLFDAQVPFEQTIQAAVLKLRSF